MQTLQQRHVAPVSLLSGRNSPLGKQDMPALPLCARAAGKGRVFRCPKCGWIYHRDGVGAINIRQKYLSHSPVVGAMAPPISIRVVAGVARTEKVYVRANVCMGNCAEAAGLRDHAECHSSRSRTILDLGVPRGCP